MDFVKKHYEKIILGIVLVGLAVAVAFIPFKVSNEKKDLDEKRINLIPRSVKPLTNLEGEALAKGIRVIQELGLDKKYGYTVKPLAAVAA